MRRLTHTADSLRLAEFLGDYPGQWHSVASDKQTQRALDRVISLYPGRVEVVRYAGYAQAQIRFKGDK